MEEIELTVNERKYKAAIGPRMSLLELLRDGLGVMGPKAGCNTGDCGACSVLLDGKLVKACITHAFLARGKKVITIEGLGRPGKLHPLQQAFYEKYAAQCGFCTPGMILAAKSLLDKNLQPSLEEIKEALSGNLCRCTGYAKIIAAVQLAANELNARRK